MIRLSCITHSEKNVQDKVRIFHDYFRYSFSRNNHKVLYSSESHLGILNRIKDRSKLYNLHPSSHKVIELYLSRHPLLNSVRDKIARKGQVKKILNQIRAYWSAKNYINVENAIDELLSILPSAIFKDSKDYFEAILNKLIEILSNGSGLADVKDDLVYYSELLAAEYQRVGFSSKEVNGTNSIFDRIFSGLTDISFEDSFYSPFPLPNSILELRGDESFESEVIKYFENRSFSDQFFGLYSIFKEKEERVFIFRIDHVNVSGREDLIFEFNDVTFIEFDNLKFDFSEWSSVEKERFDNFANKKKSILALVPVTYFSVDVGKKQALYKIKDALGSLNFKFGTGGILDNEEFYAFKDKGAIHQWSDSKLSVIVRTDKSKSEIVAKPIVILPNEKMNIEIKDHLLKCDKILFRAYNTEYLDDEILYYWRYIESIFSPITKFENKNVPKIFQALERINLRILTQLNQGRIFNSVFNLIGNSNKELINCDLSDIELVAFLNKNKSSDVAEFKNVAQHYFLDDLYLAGANLKNDGSNELNVYCSNKYFKELYEQRNIILHQGDYCFDTVQNLRKVLPYWLKVFRNELLNFGNLNLEISTAKEILNMYIGYRN